jgi:hypothetical protein
MVPLTRLNQDAIAFGGGDHTARELGWPELESAVDSRLMAYVSSELAI